MDINSQLKDEMEKTLLQILLHFLFFLRASSAISLCDQITVDNSSTAIKTWYRNIAALVENVNLKRIIHQRAPKTLPKRSQETFIVKEEEIFPHERSNGFRFELSLWYMDWKISRIWKEPSSPEWRLFEGGGLLFNSNDGGDSVYIYPDGETCLVGRWMNGDMREAREDQIESVGFIKLMTSPLTFMHVL